MVEQFAEGDCFALNSEQIDFISLELYASFMNHLIFKISPGKLLFVFVPWRSLTVHWKHKYAIVVTTYFKHQ